MFGTFFWCEVFPAFGLHVETWPEYGVSLCIHSQCGVMQTLSKQMTLELYLVILIPLYFKFTVKNWLNDCEDIKLVFLTHVALFH